MLHYTEIAFTSLKLPCCVLWPSLWCSLNCQMSPCWFGAKGPRPFSRYMNQSKCMHWFHHTRFRLNFMWQALSASKSAGKMLGMQSLLYVSQYKRQNWPMLISTWYAGGWYYRPTDKSIRLYFKLKQSFCSFKLVVPGSDLRVSQRL